MDEFSLRNGTGTYTDGVGATVGDGSVVIWFRWGSPGDEHWTFLLIFVPRESLDSSTQSM